MLEQGGSQPGTFRIRSTGYAGATANCHPVVVSGVCEKQSIIATYKRASFLDYLYFTQLETSDPVTYGDPNTSAGQQAITGAYQAVLEVPRREGRYETIRSPTRTAATAT